jgi:sortase (surface protein transpeptidase)
MGWYITELDGQRTTQWTVPEKSAGWHPNSAGAGAAGNVIISGHQLLGDAVFAPLALGDVLPGQIVLLTDADGRVFVYRVTEVSDPLPISTNLADEMVLGRQVMEQTGPPRLTMITGWPDFTTTHRVIVVAEFLGIAK